MDPLEVSLDLDVDVDGNTTLNGESSEEMSNSQKPTQPLYNDESESDDDDEDDDDYDESCWGMLYPYQFGLPVVRLEQDTIKVGRSTGCDTVITTNHCSQMFLDSISKIHFEIKKTPHDGIRLLDKSTNGTSVGDGEADKIIGKKNHVGVLLEHNKIISMSGYKSYVFMRTGPSFKNKDLYPKELRNRYIPSIQLGKGASGEVILAFRKEDSKGFAVKCLDKEKSKDTFKRILEEGNVLRQLDHKAIVKFEEQIETKDRFFIVLELAPGGELFDMIVKRQKFDESQAKMYFYQMISAIQYLHENHIIHRDLKPENMLMCASEHEELKGLVPTLKISDFGLCRIMEANLTKASTFVGTFSYIAPEMLLSKINGLGVKREYDYKVDIWSLGVILYVILSGTQPFIGPPETLIKQIKKADFVFGGCDWNRMPKAKDLVSKMIVKDPNRRLSANEVLAHPWLQDPKIIVKAKSLMGARLLFPPKVMIKLPEKQAIGNSLAKRESPPNDSEDSNPIAAVDYENNEKSRNGQPKPIVASPPRKKTKRVKLENREIQI